MSEKNSKPKAIYRIRAYDTAWSEIRGFPIDLKTMGEVTGFLVRWEKRRFKEMILGSNEASNDNLAWVSCIEMEVFYE